MAGLGRFIPKGLGWYPDLPDPRDFTISHPAVRQTLSVLSHRGETPASVDLRRDDEAELFSTVDDQGTLNSSTAFACGALVEYFERKSLGRTFEGSALFVHEMSQGSETAGRAAGIRRTIKTLRRYGIPPEELRPYSDKSATPSTDLRLLGYSTLLADAVYFRLDRPDQSSTTTLTAVRSFLAAGFPVIFGFIVPYNLTENADIILRPGYDSYRGGQTVLAVGFDDDHFAGEEGAILFRNSWGTNWGIDGYGWLPYTFIEHHCAADFWTILQDKWMDPQEFDRPAVCVQALSRNL